MRSLLHLFGFVSSALAAVVPAVEAPRDSSIFTVPEILAYDAQSAKLLFNVPPPQTGLGDDESLTFELQAHSSDSACGSRDIFLNGEPLRRFWSEGFEAHGSHDIPSLPGRGSAINHAYNISWSSICLSSLALDSSGLVEPADGTVELLTVTISSTETVAFEQPPTFLLSLTQLDQPELLRIGMFPSDFDPEHFMDNMDTEEWRFPPPPFRLNSMDLPGYPTPPPSDSDPFDDTTPLIPSIEDELQELKDLELQALALAQQIKDKKTTIKDQLDAQLPSLKQELKGCNSLMCAIKAVFYKIRIALLRLHPSIPSSNHTVTNDYLNHSNQQHLTASGEKSSTPNPEKAPSVSNITDHYYKLHGYNLVEPHNHYVQIFEVLAAIFGIAVICRFFRFLRCCCSPRRRADCAAYREELRTRRAYRRAERAHWRAQRRRAWKQWWTDLWMRKQHPTDYEEKRALILDQEGRLEDVMQDEIRRLEEGYKEGEDGPSTMQDELRELRNAHQVVNDLVHAESSRIYAAQTHPYRERRHSGASRMSRTSSLPSYSTDPPVYTPRYVSSSDEDDSFSIGTASSSDDSNFTPPSNGFTRYTPSTSTTLNVWTPPSSGRESTPLSPVGSVAPSIIASSIIDVSPRESGETIRTTTTGRAGSPRIL